MSDFLDLMKKFILVYLSKTSKLYLVQFSRNGAVKYGGTYAYVMYKLKLRVTLRQGKGKVVELSFY